MKNQKKPKIKMDENSKNSEEKFDSDQNDSNRTDNESSDRLKRKRTYRKRTDDDNSSDNSYSNSGNYEKAYSSRDDKEENFNRSDSYNRSNFNRDSSYSRDKNDRSSYNRDRSSSYNRDRNSSYNRDRNSSYNRDRNDRSSSYDRRDGNNSYNRDRNSNRSSYNRDDNRSDSRDRYSNRDRGNRSYDRDKRDSGNYNRDNRYSRDDRSRDDSRSRYNRDDRSSNRDSRSSYSRDRDDNRGSYNRDRSSSYDNRRSSGRYDNKRSSGRYDNKRSNSRYPIKRRPSRPKIYKTYDAQIPEDGLMRLNKFISNSGLCSRREADEFITTGVVTVNGEVITELGVKVNITDDIQVNEKSVVAERKVYILLNKPKGLVTTLDDPHAKKTVMDLLRHCCKERIYPVGRLDKASTGVLLLTNDGELTTRLTQPKYKKKKIYHVHLDKDLTEDDMAEIVKGVKLEDGISFADEIGYPDPEDKTRVGIEIHSGKNRIIRRLFQHLGYKVKKLDRVYFAGLTKKALGRGKWRFLSEREVGYLKMNAFDA